MTVTDHLLITRRRILAGLAVGCGAVLTACGAATPIPPDVAPNAGLSQISPSTVGQVPAAPRTTSSDPLAAVAVIAADTPTTQARVSGNATSVATDTPVPATTDTPVASATLTSAPTATSTPTAIPIPYVASRLTDVLGQSVTSYAGSIANRVVNVQLATRLINGATIAPGAVFSFDDRVGDQTQAHGFTVAYGIVNGKDGVPETVKADAGGICQVATTLFQAVYWAGLPVVRRYHHLYWIAHYGSPPYGMIGLDATVDFAPVDFQFRNTTNDWIRIEATYDSSHVRMRIIGVNQGWKVTAGTPKVFNTIKVDRTPVTESDPTQNPGWTLWVSAAEDGFDVTIERLVKSKAGELVDRYVFTNHYEPARNVKMVGTKGLLPPAAPVSAAPTASVPTDSTPTASTSPVPTVSPIASPSNAALAPGPSATSTPGTDGRIRVPALIGLSEAQARQSVAGLGLANTFANYQGPSDLPAATLNQVAVGAVLSQLPAPGTPVAPGTTVYLAVRKS